MKCGAGSAGFSVRRRPQPPRFCRRLSRAWLVIAVACASLAADVARAQVTATGSYGKKTDYEQVVRQALAEYDAQHYSQARALFEQAHLLAPSARTLRGLGVTAFALNRFTQARTELQAALIDARSPLTSEQQNEVNAALAWMQANLGTLQLRLTPGNAFATVDELPVPVGLCLFEPGAHTLRVSAPNFVSHAEDIVIERAKVLELNVELAPSPQAAAATSVAVAPSSSPAPAVAGATEVDRPESSSVFRSWWFWTITGVVIGAAAVTVVALTHEPDARSLPAGIRVTTH